MSFNVVRFGCTVGTSITHVFMTIDIRPGHFNTSFAMLKDLGDIHRLKLFTVNAIRSVWKGRKSIYYLESISRNTS